MVINVAQDILRFLDENGKVKQWPAKQAMKLAVCEYLAGKFEPDVDYTEHDVNSILASWHTFDDYFILRRLLVELGFLCRMRDGSKYWKNKERKDDTIE